MAFSLRSPYPPPSVAGRFLEATNKCQEDAEMRSFWVLFQLTGGSGLQGLRDYLGVPAPRKPTPPAGSRLEPGLFRLVFFFLGP